ncbi:NOT2 / NOT3 / NOT5 family protein [Cryptosporidium meleagridis]|uniref:NOT2 / NOT3 / NOT5 family protein n=1 Tax=Cryptosporidium meleagridis TaxID=93969 RepID=A0A2P4YY60_9CRYT|nr:NOT2 / NOT3 / NOT5 family protein [Cryptosporidium meleagridis]
MADNELNLIYSIFSKCESDLKAIVSIVNILSKNKYDVNKFETEIREIKEKLHIVEKKIVESRIVSSNQTDFVSEKYILENCHESLQSLKGSIVKFREIKIKNVHLQGDKKLQINDFESKSVGDLLNDEFFELKIDNEAKLSQINADNYITDSFSQEKLKNDNNIYTRERIVKPGNNTERPIDAKDEYKHSIGFRLDVFKHLNTDILDNSFNNKLELQDSIGKHIQYTPRMVWHNPRSDFPSRPLEKLTKTSFFDKLALDTLFFIFYFQQGTFQQFLSIQELKRKKWQFHKKCFAWFYKRSDSKITTEDAEVADYIYFDFEKDWCQKIKNDFAFEFIHLDDTPIFINKNNEANSCYNSKACADKDQIGFNSDISGNIINADGAIKDHCTINHLSNK